MRNTKINSNGSDKALKYTPTYPIISEPKHMKGKHKAAAHVIFVDKAQKIFQQTKDKVKTIFELYEHHAFKRTPVRLIPRFHLKKIERNKAANFWEAVGNDPQMLLEPNYPIQSAPSGWYMLEYHFKSKHPAPHQLFIDLGEGFMPAVSLTWGSAPSHKNAFPIYLPSNWKALRFDPLNHEGRFQMRDVFLRRLSKRPDNLSAENLTVYQYLEHYQENHNVSGWLSPIQELTPINDNPLHLKSEGEDPYFIWEQPNPNGISAGWYVWQTKINQLDKPNQSTTARLYLDTGTGFNEFETINLPLSTKRESVSRVFFTPKDVKQIRFDPIDYPGDFKLEALNIDVTTEKEALDMMLNHLSFTKKYEGKSSDDILLSIKQNGSFSSKSIPELVLSSYEETQVGNDTLINYREWIDTIENQLIPSPVKIKQTIANFAVRPVISVIIPTYNTPIKYLRLCIESVINQSYPHWELCITDDQSPNKDIRNILEEYAQKDSRIKYTVREQNGHISAASNSALALATGDYVALMDHDDALPTYALFFVANEINEHPDAEIIYSDEDKIDGDGLRSDPNFKPDWSPDLFFSQNYVSHLGVYKKSLLDKIDGFRIGVEGSQDYDLLLRCLPHIKAVQIKHIPYVLYHWRILPGSTAMGSGEKDYTTQAGIQSLENYFAQVGTPVEVEKGKVPNTYRVSYPIPSPAPLASLLIPTRDKVEVIEVAIRSILEKTTYPNYEILILDNGSIEAKTLAYFEQIQAQDKRIRVLRWDFPFNYSAINNFGAQHAKGEILGLINNDVEIISPEWLTEMVSHALRPEIGCVGAKLYYANDTLQHAGVLLGVGGIANHAYLNTPRSSQGAFAKLVTVQNYSAVTAAALLVRADVFHQVNGLNEENLTVAFNDVDFCLKVGRCGFRNVWTPYAELYHYESISRGAEDNPEKLARFALEVQYMKQTWGDLLVRDPMYNPNLSLAKQDFSITSTVHPCFKFATKI